MEHMIASLLEDFENGKMSRRQLIRSLTIAAVAVPTAGLAAAQVAPAARAGSAPWKTVCLDHISYAVSDYKKSVEFYTNLMGWEVRSDNGTNQASLNIDDIGSIIIRNGRRRANTAQTEQTARPVRPPITGVINHVSWGVEPWDTEAVRAELEGRGLSPRPDMVGETFKSFHVTDPDGWDLQISNKTRKS
jgi:catechol 2,3-dioxygenase-like lactoylglutathione lyase family enzyme